MIKMQWSNILSGFAKIYIEKFYMIYCTHLFSSWSQNLSNCRTTAEELQNRMNKNRPTQPPSSGPIDSIWNLRLEAALLQCMDAHHSLGLNEEKTAGRPEEELCSSLLKLLDDEDNVDTLTINRYIMK